MTTQREKIIRAYISSLNKRFDQDVLSNAIGIPIHKIQIIMSQINENEKKYKDIRFMRVKPNDYEMTNSTSTQTTITEDSDKMSKKGINQFKRRKKAIQIGKQTRQSLQAENQLMNQILKENFKNATEVQQLLI